MFPDGQCYHYPLIVKYLLKTPVVFHSCNNIVSGPFRFSYSQLYERIGRLSQALSQKGIAHGTRVAVMEKDSHRYLECFHTIPMMGAVLYTVNLRLSLEQIVHTMNHSKAKYLIINEDYLGFFEKIKNQLPYLEGYITIKDYAEGPSKVTHTDRFLGDYDELLNQAPTKSIDQFEDFDENTMATTFYTTGTVGLPKAVHFTHRQIVLQTLSLLSTFGTTQKQGLLHREDVYMPLTPLFHAHGWGVPYATTMLKVRQVYPLKYTGEHLLHLIQEEKVTFSHCVPTILNMILKAPHSSDYDLSKWKVIIGGAALSKQMTYMALQRGIDIYTAYGLSEMAPIVALTQLTREEHELSLEEQAKLRMHPNTPFALVDLAINSDHEITLRAPWATESYLDDEENSKKLWKKGRLHTQDVGHLDERGRLTITDRLKDLVKVGGEWLSSLKMEDVINAHPAIEECAVVGMNDKAWGEIPLVLAVLKKEHAVKERELTGHLKEAIEKGHLQREAICSKIQFVTTIPKTSVGKIDKKELRKLYNTHP